ncbi:MAG: DUF418 domain-containing protein [bacterium]|nr:DUF418 domain-containing protein [bacterium]
MSDTLSTNTPTRHTDRIESLDILRGFAVLGILVMNIQSFSMISAAYLNPTAYGDLTGLNRLVWVFSHLLTDMKFMALFSMMFGAGIFLMTSRTEAKGRSAAGFHYRRTFWLLTFGLLHAHLLWYGDILYTYAICALLIYFFRKLSPKTLIIIGILLLAIPSAMYGFIGFSMPHIPPEGKAQMMLSWNPDAETVEHELEAMRSGWTDQMSHRSPEALAMQTFIFLILLGWRAGGQMLIGMALFKLGVLSAKRSKKFYSLMMVFGFGAGLPIVAYGIMRNFAAEWSVEYSMFLGFQYNYWGSVAVALGYIGLVMLICLSAPRLRFLKTLASVGRMALTAYLLQTIICTAIFYGHGFGLFGSVDRISQIAVVLMVWVLLLVLCPLWLRHFRFGPFEWLWRTLTYMKVQPLRRVR